MAKLVCDFAQVKSTGDKLCTMASDLQSAISDYGSNIDGTLSSWNGEAKSSFSGKCSEQVQASMQMAKEAEAVGEFIKKAAQAIEELDEQLASLSI